MWRLVPFGGGLCRVAIRFTVKYSFFLFLICQRFGGTSIFFFLVLIVIVLGLLKVSFNERLLHLRNIWHFLFFFLAESVAHYPFFFFLHY